MLPVSVSAAVSVSAIEARLKRDIPVKLQSQLSAFSNVEMEVVAQLPDRANLAMDQAVSFNYQLADYNNYLGRSSILVQLIDSNRRPISTIKAIVDVTAIGNYVVATKVLPKGHEITSSDVVIRRDTVNGQSRLAFGSLTSVIGKEATSTISEGSTLTQLVVRDIPDVRKGDIVWVDYRHGGIQVRIQGESLGDGKIGDKVRVRLRLDSHKVMEGEIVDSTTVRVRTSN
jgi:flagella basal body P-ring formation protein FlgA